LILLKKAKIENSGEIKTQLQNLQLRQRRCFLRQSIEEKQWNEAFWKAHPNYLNYSTKILNPQEKKFKKSIFFILCFFADSKVF
jgi:hypothetical protein